MKIEEYSDKYAQRLCHICAATSDAGESKKRQANTCALYCDIYLESGLNYVLLDELGEAQGYILCSPSYADYAERLKSALPGLALSYRRIAKSGEKIYKRYADEYPAHLHADILEGFTGRGNGAMLMERLLAELKERKISGVMLQTGSGNKKAIRFYEKQGFSVLNKGIFVTVMGRRI